MFCGCREAITLPKSWFGGRCPIRGDTSSFFKERGGTGVHVCIKRTYYKEL